MKIDYFRIENYKNLKLVECENVPDFVVICGANGSGKSSILEALMTAKEAIGSYSYFQKGQNVVSADAEESKVKLRFKLNESDKNYLLKKNPNTTVSDICEAEIIIDKAGNVRFGNQNGRLLRDLLRDVSGECGIVDYFSAHRGTTRNTLNSWSSNFLNDDNVKQMLANGQSKHQFTKHYLTSLKMRELQELQRMDLAGSTEKPNFLFDIRSFFNDFFAPMEFDDVYIDTNPFRFNIKTPRGDIDIDDLSSGEKEILNTFIHFHQLSTENSIIFFDEPDIHLHPELGRKYLNILKSIGANNQFFITTHSPEMMMATEFQSLFNVLKYTTGNDINQFVPIGSNEEMHNVIKELVGPQGFTNLNSKIVFIEGEYTSSDIQFYEKFYSNKELKFIPASNSSTTRSTTEKINSLLESTSNSQKYYSIIDKDIDREFIPPDSRNLFKLPVYHIENYLLCEESIFKTLKMLHADKCKYETINEITEELQSIAINEHLLPYTKALLDSEVNKMTKQATDFIYQKNFDALSTLEKIDFNDVKEDASVIIEEAIENGTWKEVCKGRDLIKGLCKRNNLEYSIFRNCLIHHIEKAPESLDSIIQSIIND